MKVRAHIIVSGVVQGVGYRQYVLRHARHLQLTGSVRNLPTREVEITAEGERGLIEGMIKDLPTINSWATVRNVQTRWGAYAGEFSGFEITY